MISQLPLTADELLSTTRTVRKRLDFSRPVKREAIEECLEIAHQAPTSCNMQNWHFVVVTDSTKRAELGAIYRKGWELYLPMPFSVSNLSFDNPSHQAMQGRVGDSAQYLADNIEKVPALVIPVSLAVSRIREMPSRPPCGARSRQPPGTSRLPRMRADLARPGRPSICSMRKRLRVFSGFRMPMSRKPA